MLHALAGTFLLLPNFFPCGEDLGKACHHCAFAGMQLPGSCVENVDELLRYLLRCDGGLPIAANPFLRSHGGSCKAACRADP